jgi:putative transposase
MARRFFQVYIHLIWHTKSNKPVLKGALESFVHQRMRFYGEELGLKPLGINSAWNHTHSLFAWHPCVAIADAVRELKSRVSTEWNAGVEQGIYNGPNLQWQLGYGALSIRQHQIPTVVAYIDNQKIHHADGRLAEDFERVTDFETDTPHRGAAEWP